MILPDLPAFLDGKYQPRDNDERLALLGICQFTNRTRALARLYADAFAAAPQLAEDVGGRPSLQRRPRGRPGRLRPRRRCGKSQPGGANALA